MEGGWYRTAPHRQQQYLEILYRIQSRTTRKPVESRYYNNEYRVASIFETGYEDQTRAALWCAEGSSKLSCVLLVVGPRSLLRVHLVTEELSVSASYEKTANLFRR